MATYFSQSPSTAQGVAETSTYSPWLRESQGTFMKRCQRVYQTTTPTSSFWKASCTSVSWIYFCALPDLFKRLPRTDSFPQLHYLPMIRETAEVINVVNALSGLIVSKQAKRIREQNWLFCYVFRPHSSTCTTCQTLTYMSVSAQSYSWSRATQFTGDWTRTWAGATFSALLAASFSYPLCWHSWLQCFSHWLLPTRPTLWQCSSSLSASFTCGRTILTLRREWSHKMLQWFAHPKASMLSLSLQSYYHRACRASPPSSCSSSKVWSCLASGPSSATSCAPTRVRDTKRTPWWLHWSFSVSYSLPSTTWWAWYTCCQYWASRLAVLSSSSTHTASKSKSISKSLNFSLIIC